MAASPSLFFVFFLLMSFSNGAKVVLVNNCKDSIWPGILSSAGHQTPNDGGFHLPSGQQTELDLPDMWSGRIWGRQGCFFDAAGMGTCHTGDCSGRLQCQGMSGTPPTTLVEMTFGSATSPVDYYDVSLVDGFNIPVSMEPVGGGTTGCGIASCTADLNRWCPAVLQVRKGKNVVGCMSACLALHSDQTCCTGIYGSRRTCRPSMAAHLFKASCPKAYSFAFDQLWNLNKCWASRYVLTFCPSIW